MIVIGITVISGTFFVPFPDTTVLEVGFLVCDMRIWLINLYHIFCVKCCFNLIIGNPPCYPHGIRACYLDHCTLQEIEILVALGMYFECALTIEHHLYDLILFCSLFNFIKCLTMQVAEGEPPIIASHGLVFETLESARFERYLKLSGLQSVILQNRDWNIQDSWSGDTDANPESIVWHPCWGM